MTDLTPYVSRLLLTWNERFGSSNHQSSQGSLVFADVSGFTALSERLARKGKIGAEEMADIITALFTELLGEAAMWGGEMLKFGGDALLLLFQGSCHEARATRAAWEMQRRLKSIGRIDTGHGRVVLRMSVGISSGPIDFFVVGRTHQELLVLGPTITEMVAMESAADATEVLVSARTAAALESRVLGAAKEGGRLIARAPETQSGALLPGPQDQDCRRFLSRLVFDHLSGGPVDAEHRVSTIAFVQYMGTDDLLAKKGPAVLAALLDDAVSVTEEVLDRHEVAFLATDVAADGAKVMAAAGAPRTTGADEERVLRAALEIARLSGPLGVRVGVNNGRIFAGAVGPSFRKTYTALGDPTNTAARIMGRARPGQVLTLGSVLQATRVEFDASALEPFLAKGKQEPLTPYLVRAPKGKKRTTSDLPLVGRDAPLRELEEVIPTAGRRGGVAEVIGGTGMGKSQVIDELVRRAETQRVKTARHDCVEHESNRPFSVTAGILRPLFGETAADLVGSVTQLAPELLPFCPLIGIAADVEVAATPEVEALAPQFFTETLERAVLQLLGAAGEVDPLLLVIEDAQHADPSSLSLLARVGADPPLGCSLCVTRGEVPLRVDLNGLQVELEPLNLEDAQRLARLAAARGLLPEDAMAVAVKSGGNPLFLLELVRSLETASPGELPESVEVAVARRLDDLDGQTLTAVRGLSVLGAASSVALADDLLGSESLDLLRRGAQTLVQVTPDTVRFEHSLLQHAAYEGLSFKRRRTLHADVVRLLETTADPPVDQLALHAARAGLHDKAWRWSLRAAADAQAKYAHGTAAEHFRRALDSASAAGVVNSERAAAWRALGDSLYFGGRTAEAEAAFATAGRLMGGAGANRAELLMLVGVAREKGGDLGGAARAYGRALGVLSRSDSAKQPWPWFVRDLFTSETAIEARCLTARAVLRWRRRKLREAEADAVAALEVSRKAGDRAGQGHALMALHLLQKLDGGRLEAEAAPLFEAVGDRVALANLLNNLGMESHLAGDWQTATSRYSRSRDEQLAAGNVTGAAAVASNLAEVFTDQGRAVEARRLLEEALATFFAASHWMVVTCLLNLATALIRLCEFDAARTVLARAENEATRRGLPQLLADAPLRRAELELTAGGTPEGRAALHAAAAADSPRGQWLLAIADLQEGRTEESRSRAQQALSTATAFDRLLLLETLGILGAEHRIEERRQLAQSLEVVRLPPLLQRM